MSTKTLKNPAAVAKLKGIKIRLMPFNKQKRYKIPIRNNLKQTFKPTQQNNRKDAA